MKHPLQMLAPHFALAAFALAGVLGWRAGTGPLALTLRCITAFFLTYLLVRGCGSLLRAGGGASQRRSE